MLTMGIGEIPMTTYKGGDAVTAGFYVNRAAWSVTTVSGQKGGTLPGTDIDPYVRVPGLLVLMMAPIMGAVFAMFLPFIGIALLLSVGAKNVVTRFTTPPLVPVPPSDEAKAKDVDAVGEHTKKAA